MITFILVLVFYAMAMMPSQYFRELSSDTRVIIFFLCVISDIHIFISMMKRK